MNKDEKIISQMINRQNNQAREAFEGYSPFEMYNMVYDPFGPYSPMELRTLPDEEYEEIHLFANYRYLVQRIAEAGEIKLTAAGYLPPALCRDIYRQGNIKDYFIETGYTKSFRENDTEILNLIHVLTEMTSVVKKRYNRLSLTAGGLRIYRNNALLFEDFFRTYTLKYNWGYQDGYHNEEIGRTGFLFSLFLLSKYGGIPRSPEFYADLYFKAFPALAVQEPDMSVLSYINAYNIRSIIRFMAYFHFCSVDKEFYIGVKEIQKTPVFEKLFVFHPHIDYSDTVMA
ncbi:MAG: hypothetical protein PHX07_00675 [Candidatus Marinimicrobia bacterium]|nr:hypothetical protein [Candidatus Neomarinimicrobiota bacterium]